jgi:predicted SAM-dependent methyltransferase
MKFIISWIIRFVPRTLLQRFSHLFLNILKVFYLGNRVECPVCSARFRKFLPYGRKPPRENALCPNCLSLERHRLLWLYLQERTSFFTASLRFLHIAPELCFIHRFKKLENLEYVTADLESPLAQIKMDIHEIPFKNNTFDVIMCNHVLEHVKNDIHAMKEIFRVLKPGGWAIMQVPFMGKNLEKTFEDDSVSTPMEREQVFGQRDHVRIYGRDYPNRLRQAGFRVKEDNFGQDIDREKVVRYSLPAEEIIYLAWKN